MPRRLEATMTQDHLTLLAFGIAIALAIPVEIWVRRRRRDPWRLMDWFTDLEGKEWYYLKPTRDDPAGS
jgi:hypothetical protein